MRVYFYLLEKCFVGLSHIIVSDTKSNALIKFFSVPLDSIRFETVAARMFSCRTRGYDGRWRTDVN